MALSAWFNAAAHINANDGSFTSEFVRGTTEAVMRSQGAPVTDTQFQTSSNALATTLLNKIIHDQSIDTAQAVVNLDIKNAGDTLNMPAWGWAGAITDFLPEPFGLNQDLASVPLDKMDVMTGAALMGFTRAFDRMLDDGVISTVGEFESIIDATGKSAGDFIFDLIHPTIPCTAVRNPTISYVTYRQWVNTDTDGDDDEGYYQTICNRIVTPSADPLILNLNGIGIETVGTGAGVLFDANGTGIKHPTGWVAATDGFLVLDRNGNGTIDNGTELFGNSTPLAGGGTAANGYAALAAQDTNHDNAVNSLDANWNNLRVWQDLNQDGVSQSNELYTLGAEGIASLYLGVSTSYNSTQTGGTVSGVSSYTRTDGTFGFTGDVNLAQDTFVRSFTAAAPIATAAQSLPAMGGSGSLRDLREAASLQTAQGATLLAALTAFASSDGMSQHNQMDALIADWVATSTQQTSLKQAMAQGLTLHYINGGGDVGATQAAYINRMIGALEVFGGADFANGWAAPAAGVTDIYLGLGDLLDVTLLETRYNALKDAIYGALAMQTRLKPYLDSIGLGIGAGGNLQFDLTAFNALIASKKTGDQQGALIDLIDLSRYAGDSLGQMGWSAEAGIAGIVGALQGTAQLAAVKSLFNLDAANDAVFEMRRVG
jgi:hypothetical protein